MQHFRQMKWPIRTSIWSGSCSNKSLLLSKACTLQVTRLLSPPDWSMPTISRFLQTGTALESFGKQQPCFLGQSGLQQSDRAYYNSGATIIAACDITIKHTITTRNVLSHILHSATGLMLLFTYTQPIQFAWLWVAAEISTRSPSWKLQCGDISGEVDSVQWQVDRCSHN